MAFDWCAAVAGMDPLHDPQAGAAHPPVPAAQDRGLITTTAADTHTYLHLPLPRNPTNRMLIRQLLLVVVVVVARNQLLRKQHLLVRSTS